MDDGQNKNHRIKNEQRKWVWYFYQFEEIDFIHMYVCACMWLNLQDEDHLLEKTNRKREVQIEDCIWTI